MTNCPYGIKIVRKRKFHISNSILFMKEQRERKMFYGAKPITFIRARNLRSSMTSAETILWERLRKNQLLGFRFKSQHPIHCFIADFYCHKAKLVIEIDGKIHLNKLEYDRDRTKCIEQFGLKLIRFTNEEISEDIDRVIEILKEYLLPFLS